MKQAFILACILTTTMSLVGAEPQATSVTADEPIQQAEKEFLFTCKNDWMAAVEVKVPAISVDEARRILKTENPYRRDYKLCSYRGEREMPKRPKPINEDQRQVNPTE